ncbi:MAG: glutathione synthase [Pseudomonadota bacterium]
MRIAIQMDPIDGIDIEADTTFAFMLEAAKRGHEQFYYTPNRLTLDGPRLCATGHAVEVRAEKGNHASLGPQETLDLASVDVVLLRQDPPFDMGYITATHLLEHIVRDTLVVNDPASVRNAPEKLLVMHFPDLMPPSLISLDPEALAAFRDRHRDIVLKPLYGAGGAGVFHLPEGDRNFNAVIELFTDYFRVPMIAQAYVPAVRKGDKRIILIDGIPVGAVNRVPAEGEARSNLHVGGRAEAAPLTARDKAICERIGPLLRDQNLLFVGIDVIGDVLTEINVTSPTGVQEIRRLGGPDIAALFWDAVEAKLG